MVAPLCDEYADVALPPPSPYSDMRRATVVVAPDARRDLDRSASARASSCAGFFLDSSSEPAIISPVSGRGGSSERRPWRLIAGLTSTGLGGRGRRRG
jgi:hypothetical protein